MLAYCCSIVFVRGEYAASTKVSVYFFAMLLATTIFLQCPLLTSGNMDFVTPQVKRKKNDIDNTSDARIKMVTKVPIPLELQISAAGKPVILSLTPGYSEPYIPLYSKGVLPQPLISFF